MRFNTFKSVVAWYDMIKPMVSKNHTLQDDVRPIGARNRKWERIRKVDENTYVLLDGFYCSTLFSSRRSPEADLYEQDMAPIMWKREEDGDYIYVRNGKIHHMLYCRYNFLRWYLPTNMGFAYNQQGKHWVRAQTVNGYEDFPLPKTAYQYNSTTKECGVDDGKRLKFRVNEDGTFTRVGEAFKVEKTTVDKELKKQWKGRIEAFYIQAAALAPMLDTTWNGRNEYRSVVADWCKENKVDFPNYGGLSQMPSALARQIVEQDDHPLRIPLIALVIDKIGGTRPIETKDDLMEIRSAYNRLMNKVLGMSETKEV